MSCIANQIGDSKNNGKGKDKKEPGLVGASSGAMISASTPEDLGTLVGTLLFAYDEAGHLIGEYDELGNRIREYVWLGDQPVAMVQDDGVYYIHSDHLNTPKVVTDQQQQIVWKGDYKPFGEVEEIVETVKMNLRFPGQYEDAETGLNYNYFRSYDSAAGRYLQSDHIGLRGGVNTYVYVNASPVVMFDPFGLKRVPVYEIRKGIYMIFYSAVFRESCGTEPMGCADYHPTESILWTGEVDDSCKLSNTMGEVITGPREWFGAHVQWESASHTEYVYKSDDCGVDCSPTNLEYEKTSEYFPNPGSKGIGDDYD